MCMIYHILHDNTGKILRIYPEGKLDRIREFGKPIPEREWFKNLSGEHEDAYPEPYARSFKPLSTTEYIARTLGQ